MDRDDLLNEIITREARARFYEAAEAEQFFVEADAREANARRLSELVASLTALDRGRWIH